MPVLYNHTNEVIRIKLAWEESWIEIPPEAEVQIGDFYAALFFGWGLEHEAQLKECWNRLRILGNEISYEDFLKIHDTLTSEKVIKTGKKREIQ